MRLILTELKWQTCGHWNKMVTSFDLFCQSFAALLDLVCYWKMIHRHLSFYNKRRNQTQQLFTCIVWNNYQRLLFNVNTNSLKYRFAVNLQISITVCLPSNLIVIKCPWNVSESQITLAISRRLTTTFRVLDKLNPCQSRTSSSGLLIPLALIFMNPYIVSFCCLLLWQNRAFRNSYLLPRVKYMFSQWGFSALRE